MTTDPSHAPPGRYTVDPVAAFAVILAMLAVLAVNNRIFTYVSGQDPMTYVRAANDIVRNGWSGAWPIGGGMTAPGYPLLLAAAVAAFGPMAPYWVNVSLALLLMPLTLALLIRLGLSPRASAVALFSSVLILVSGYSMNAAFLLYPFRELPAVFFTVVGTLLFVVGCDAGDSGRRRALFCFSAGICALLTAAIREPSILGFTGVAVWCLGSRSEFRRKAIALGSFATPLVLAFLVWLLFARGAAPNHQWDYWLAQAREAGPHAFADRWATIEPQMRYWLFEELGLFWTAMAALGLWALRQQPRALLTFLVPFALLYLFYGFIEAHRRYLLSSLVFLAPMAGYGLAWIIETVTTRLPTVRPALLAAPPAAALLGVACALVPVAMDLQPTGPRVKAPQIDRFRQVIGQAVTNGEEVLLSPYCRYAADAIQSFSDLHPRSPLNIKPGRLAGVSFAVLTPLNEQARFRGLYVPYSGPDASAIVNYFADLDPVRDSSGMALTLTLGHGLYGIHRSRPWSTTRVDQMLDLGHNTGRVNVVWMDFRNSDPSVSRNVSIANPADGSETFVATVAGRGLQPILVPAGVSSGVVHLRIRSSSPVPRDVPLTLQTGNGTAGFSLDEKRSLSVHKWLKTPFRTTSFGDKYAAVLTGDGGRIEIPMPAADSNLGVAMAFHISTSSRDRQPAVFEFVRDGQVAGRLCLATDGGNWHGVNFDNVRPGGPLCFDIRPVTANHNATWRIHRVLIAIHPFTTP